jgi:hypothetical protein
VPSLRTLKLITTDQKGCRKDQDDTLNFSAEDAGETNRIDLARGWV